MGCGPSRARRYQYEIADDPYYQTQNPNVTPLQPLNPGPGFGPRGRCGRRFGPPGPFGRRGCGRRPPWAQQQNFGPPQQNPAAGYHDEDRPGHDFAEEAPIPQGFKDGEALLEKEKGGRRESGGRGKGGKGEKEVGVYRDHVENRESVPPRYSQIN